MRDKLLLTFAAFLTLGVGTSAGAVVVHSKNKNSLHATNEAAVAIKAGRAQCKVDMDGRPQGTTGSGGTLTIKQIAPGDHYLHIQCPGRPEVVRFIAPSAGERLNVAIPLSVSGSARPAASGLAAAESRMRLRKIVREAVQMRSNG